MEHAKRDSFSAAENSSENSIGDSMYERSLCSATDCTGLIPALPASDSELASYEALYHFLPKARNQSRAAKKNGSSSDSEKC